MIKRFFNQKGFTLLELLVVIGIIAILVAVGTASYSTVQKKARDAKRKNDIKAIQSAVEQYYSVCGFTYPLPSSGTVGSNITCANPATTVMESVPKDPSTSLGYPYGSRGGAAGTDYYICATMEAGGGNSNGTAWVDNGIFFCVVNQQ